MKAIDRLINNSDYLQMIMGFSKKLKYDYVSSFAGNAALFLLMSLFPMLMYLISIFSYLPIQNADVSQYILNVFPTSLHGFVEQLIQEAYLGGASFLQSFAMIVTLICASKGVYAIIIGMNAVYGIRESRNYVILNLLAVIYVVAFFGLIGISIILIVLGDHIYDYVLSYIPVLVDFRNYFSVGKYICSLVIMIIILLLVYLNMPNRKSKIKYELFGAIIASFSWVIFSVLFSYYIDHFANYSVTYGSLATIVIFILWLYTSMYIVFIGAEINVVVRTYFECGESCKSVYEYYNNNYEGALKDDNDILSFISKKYNSRGNK